MPLERISAHDQPSDVGLSCPNTSCSQRTHQPVCDASVYLQGYEPIIASPKGGKVPIDPKSIQEQYLTSTSKDFLKDGTLPTPC